jgi:hypothetical protein
MTVIIANEFLFKHDAVAPWLDRGMTRLKFIPNDYT